MVKEMEIADLLTGYSVRLNEPMAPYTTLKIGGAADAMVFPRSIEDVAGLMRRLAETSIPYFVLGNGSNLLVSDSGIEGVVIHLKELDQVTLMGEAMFNVEAGVSFPKLSVMAQKQGLTGLEFAAGIPATVGGAIAMNAGIPGEETGSVVKRVLLVTSRGEIKAVPCAPCNFSYRATSLPSGVIVAAEIVLLVGDIETIESKRIALLKRRRATQPLSYFNAGSIFKNPDSALMPSAGQLIESVGLKGHQIGGAEISDQHANFIINRGQATASDVLALIQLTQERVFLEKGVRLVPEIKVIGRKVATATPGPQRPLGAVEAPTSVVLPNTTCVATATSGPQRPLGAVEVPTSVVPQRQTGAVCSLPA